MATTRPKTVQTDPEYTISLIGLVMSVAGQPLVGLILSFIGFRQSKQAGRSNLFALLGLIFGGSFAALGILIAVGYTVLAVVIAFNGNGNLHF